MGTVRRVSFLGVLLVFLGTLVALVPGGTASADESCREPVAKWLKCWTDRLENRGAWVVRLDSELALGEPERDDHDRREREEAVTKRRHQLVVEVPKGARTGQGGTVLLVLAGGRLVDPGASIDRLPGWAVDELEDAGACTPMPLCKMVREDGRDKQPLTGAQLIHEGFAADSSTQLNAFEPVPGPEPSTSSPETATDGQDDKAKGNAENNSGPNEENSSLFGSLAFWMSLVLALLLLVFVIVVRRSRGPVAVGHRAPPGRGGGSHSGGGGVAPARTPTTTNRAVPLSTRGDESTTRLRVAPAAKARHGRQVGARPAHARTAVVRTDLHPQGYVELDRVLYRAVWAEPDRRPPAPGGLVDVTDARERDSDVLYAFPPTAARHAKGTPR